ncbi:MAG: type II toxin-antitoxin system HipA family toxin [Pseudomonadota bacterium]
MAQSGRAIYFEYSDECMRRGVNLSPFRLPLQAGAVGNFPDHQQNLPGLIADALPDGWGMLVMDRLFRQHRRELHTISPLDRLAFIHDRAIGAFVFEPKSTIPTTAEDIGLLDLAKSARFVFMNDTGTATDSTAALTQLAMLGGSPHGARPKVLIQYDKNSDIIGTHPADDGTPWLVKFQAQDEHKEACAVEALYAQIARQCGLDMPDTHYFDLNAKLAAFGIERFDRKGSIRIPTLTLAGLLDDNFRLPTQDYRNFLRATRALTRNESEVKKAFERCVFNVIMNNRDDHTKNFSYLLNERLEWTLAPCYDLTFNPGPNGWHQMTVMGEGATPNGSTLMALAKDSGLDAAFARQLIDRIASAASGFKTAAQSWQIRRRTVLDIQIRIDKNLAAMLH